MTQKGKLYIVATPIGNMDDITIRAVKTLENADIIAAEDTRHTARLLSYHNIGTKLISCHEHNEAQKSGELVKRLEIGDSVALVSDAGTPLVSDPGYRLIQAALEKDIQIIPIPGVSAAITALSASGLPTDSFTFSGFPPKKSGKRLSWLEDLKNVSHTLIFYESPRRIMDFIQEIIEIMGDRYAVLSREMTKVYEEFIRGSLSEILDILKTRDSIKGECTLLITGNQNNDTVSMETLAAEIEKALILENRKISEISKTISKKYGLSKNIVYEQALIIQNKRNENG
ncbi:Ribosomal RNA small subunit methyltransferase I [Desulfonema limicola]|uniref:Ribosomal RNA small subunit methyltransferase I n=1 Tax=Desulfonema limicola TaxID=45656 RepID=A0A975B974_9BACT|nr:16S rRNA (cytidine(1402)-2'-O)-methyltransferase [Desulfonema limicola]QTA80900.1 Ribosomal RNA small subunit methyltransferase I [Desulfonema limicola]